MVLSNKKLKQKLRSLLAESLAATESKKSHKDRPNEDVDQQLQSVKELLGSKSRKPRLKKREKRRKDPALSEESKPVEGSEGTQKENGENVDQIGLKKKEKKKKRKREGEGGEEPAEKKQKKTKKAKQKKKRDGKKKKQKGEVLKDEAEDTNNEKETEIVDGKCNEKVVTESIKVDESEVKKVYVGGIPYYSSEEDIRSFFEGCGTITEVDCMTFPESGKFRGIAILTFKTEAAAKRALALDGSDMGGFFLKIQPYRASRTHKSDSNSDFAPEIMDGYNRIYVGNLSWDITEENLKQLFSDCKVSSIRFGMDKETGDFKGYAHVDFEDTLSLTIALKLDQRVVCGRPVRIRCAVPKKGGLTNSKSSGKKAEDGTSVGDSKKKKRRGTCYECGVLGHLSSDCPRRKAAKVDDSGVKGGLPNSTYSNNKGGDGISVGDSKKRKRQTCYECGIPGHLSSDCPQKKAAEAHDSGVKGGLSDSTPSDKKAEDGISVGDSKKKKKKKRQTCYECGVPGHLSSDCPRKKAAEVDGLGV